MHLAAVVLAIVGISHTLFGDDFKVSIPANAVVRSQSVNFETNGYTVLDRTTSKLIVWVVNGGGAWDLDGFHVICLNGHRAWIKQSRTSGRVIAGEPGANAVVISWDLLPTRLQREAVALAMSLRVNNGARKC